MNQDRALTAKPKPRGVGRPRKNYDDEIDVKYNYLRILLVYKRGRNKKEGPKVKAKCLLCKRITKPRLRDVRSGHTQACRICVRSRVYKRNCEGVLERLSDAERADIWRGRFLGRSRRDLACDFRWPVGIIDFANRAYQRWLDSLVDTQIGAGLLEATRARGVEIEQIAIEYSLSVEAVRYVANQVQNKLKTQGLKEQRTGEDADSVVRRIETRTRDWKAGHYPEEFTRKELRLKRDGSVLGTYSSLFCDCVAAQAIDRARERKTPTQRFLELAELTFRHRKERQKTVATRIIREDEKKREEFWVNQEGFGQESLDQSESEEDL